MLEQTVTIIHICVSCFLILLVLLQQGKGADVGATFGGGSNTIFGASGADNLLSRVTTWSALIFMCTSVFLASSIKHRTTNQGEIMQNLPTTSATTTTSDDFTQKTPEAPVTEQPSTEAAPTAPATEGQKN